MKYESAHLEGVASEKIVRSEHSTQSIPATILEVRRILYEHLGIACGVECEVAERVERGGDGHACRHGCRPRLRVLRLFGKFEGQQNASPDLDRVFEALQTGELLPFLVAEVRGGVRQWR